ncbi:hypothetical protein K439DRAFT_1664857 [Ramaria rubella]|nr:hypothetical protein K439DRAFT_1664857 [Ramaria rubella]
MSIRSPPIPGGGFRIPPAPENPPTLDDVSNAVQYTREMLTAGGQGVVRKQDVAHAYIYQTAVLNAQLKANDTANTRQDDPPNWYTAGQETIQKALSALEKKVDGIETGIGGKLDRLGKTVNEAVQKVDGMERKVSRLEQKVDQLTRKVDGLEQTVNGVSRLTSQLWNTQCESGIARPFKVVSFGPCQQMYSISCPHCCKLKMWNDSQHNNVLNISMAMVFRFMWMSRTGNVRLHLRLVALNLLFDGMRFYSVCVY